MDAGDGATAPFPRRMGGNENRMKENVSNQENSRQNGEGGRTPKHETLYRSQSAGGEGKNAGRQSGRLNAVNQRR
ncbi:hypothetical protein TNCV_4004651 [Trichonephila clavipes]|nr:hypothetical protein TNCV_4004651 [Trichonephila clavipes]